MFSPFVTVRALKTQHKSERLSLLSSWGDAAGAGVQAGSSDVLVATDVASKGLDFPDIQQVINYDMPEEIENYVHRIGRTGRCGKTGIATTFINKEQSDTILLDLKHLLVEAKQRLPPVLQVSPWWSGSGPGFMPCAARDAAACT